MIVRRAKMPERIAAFYIGELETVFVALDLGRWQEQVAVRMGVEEAKAKRGLYGVVMREALPPKPYLIR